MDAYNLFDWKISHLKEKIEFVRQYVKYEPSYRAEKKEATCEICYMEV